MDALTLVGRIAPRASVREVTRVDGGQKNRVFRLLEEGGRASVVKIYASAGRERRERHALEALEELDGIPHLIDRGVTPDGTAWAQLTDGGGWTLQSLTKNLDVLARAGHVLRGVHESTRSITNLEGGMDGDYIATHYGSTIDRLGRYRRKLQIPPHVLEAASSAPPPVSSKPVTSHTHPTPDKFLVNENGEVMLVDWEWATLAPPEWDLSLATWSVKTIHEADAAAAFLDGYGDSIGADRLESWTAYHAAMKLLDAGESRDGRLGDLANTVRHLAHAVGAG
ncbi:MAG TPA: phosphotransferase [Acidimicrobiia bacterium]|nr:phosphotransferase [Acidimicrobiia bacterium]